VSAQAYGLLFGVNIFGIMACNMLNRRMVTRVGRARMLLLGGRLRRSPDWCWRSM
jgi:hypothetical protein